MRRIGVSIYVSAMVPVKSPKEYDVQQDVIVLFCETVERALRLGYLTQDMIDDYEPALMFTIPRLAIVWDLLQTLTEEELLTLEKNLCISQDGELSTGQVLASNGIPAPVQENPPPSCLANDTSEEQDGGEEDPLPVFACPDQEEESAEVEQGWEEVETQSDEEEQEQGLLCEEAEEAELACSMQYDEEELEQLNMMVYRVGDEMSTLLSPPSQGQSPAHRPSRGEPPGSRGASSTEASPRRMQGNQGRTGVYVEEEDRVFFMEDLDAAGDSISSISRDACSCVISTSKGSTPPLQQKPAPRPGSGINGWSSETTSEQPCPQPRSLNSPCPVAKRPLCTPARGSEPLPYSNGWDRGLEGTASETAEVIAHRMGGMKLSATVIFNPRSPSLTELAVDKLLLPRPAPTEIEPCGPLMATHCLLNSCVCCGSCEDAHDDSITAETAGLELGLALGLDKHCKTPASSAVIQSAACHLPPCGHQRFSKGEISQHTPPSSRCSAEPQAEDFDSLLCEKCLVAPGRGGLSQDCSSRGGQEASTCVHQVSTDRRPQAIGVRQRDKDMENDRLENKDLTVDPKEDSRRYSRSPPSALCQVVTATVCRSPHVVCRAVLTLQGNERLSGLQRTWTSRRPGWPCRMPRWQRGTRSGPGFTAAVTSSTVSLFAYQVKELVSQLQLHVCPCLRVKYVISLFLCDAGVADQLQTNYASDLRSILKTLFEVMATKCEQGDNDKQKKGEEWI
ncbi:hypothetical protein XENOCAPTIV_013692 [Xenoophorus captivus]|uniref:Uncharacterized protein n=1 Tax=Xenoophorus captivus TaxID=1517983 RepID=A0ABV0R900_9TELE